MFYHRGFCHDVEVLHFKVVALCAVFCLLTFGPCTMTGNQNPMGYDLSSGSESVLVGDSRNQIPPQASLPKLSLENICKRSDLFCFPSTLSDFFSDFYTPQANSSGFSGVKPDEAVLVGSMQPMDNLSWSTNHGNFQLLNGDVVSCSLELKESAQDDISNENDAPSVRIKSSVVNDFSSLNVQISHSLLDWGQKYLHSPSLAYLTVENKHNRSVLNVFEPYSTNTQFYPCNYSEIKVKPGEIATICFVFLPKWLGLSSAHLILQTSSGGFLVQAQGFAVEPPYMIQSSVGLSPRVVSVFNPSDKVLDLKEVSVWTSFSSKNILYSVKGVCSLMDHSGSKEFSVKEWLDVKIGLVGQPVMAIRPQKTWTVGLNRNEPVLELEFRHRSKGNTFGSFGVQLLKKDSNDNLDTIMFEGEFGGRTDLSISLDVLVPCDADGTMSVSLLVENDGPDLLTVVNITAVGENKVSLETKYIEGLILFPHMVTEVGTVTYTPNRDMILNCKLLVQTNKSNAPEVEISCSDIASLCSRTHSNTGFEVLNYDNAETRPSNVRVQPSLEIKVSETTKADESVLGNWRSQGTKNGMSVLDDDEIMFPMVEVGSHQSKWIKVVNPSDQPVVMQLLLNSGEIINKCQGSDEILQPSSSDILVFSNHTTPSRYGFSIAGNALTEAYVHPHGKAVLGPIVFHPSSRCEWKSSALVRNNLSGVEWLSLRGSGGSPDEADPVHTVELKHDYGQLLMEILFAKNIGVPFVFPVLVLLIFVACSCKILFIIRGAKEEVTSSSPSAAAPPPPTQTPSPSSPPPLPSSQSSLVSNTIVVEALKSENLTAKTGEAKVRRRKKKRSSGAVLTGNIEVSISHRSNVTPSSPLSHPASPSFTPKRSPKLSPNQNLQPFDHCNTSVVPPPKQKPSTPHKTTTPRARAPGPVKKTAAKPEGSSPSDTRFEYNIWDSHIQLSFRGPPVVVTVMPTVAEDNNFGSFFAMNPQELFAKSQEESASFKQND